ncbi:MAG TPA: helix-turn-helix domain-containing protein [Actinocatenispora sp.]
MTEDDISSDPETIADVIRDSRRRHGLSQAKLAERLAIVSSRHTVTRDLVARWERGQVPRAEYRRWLSLALDVPADRLHRAAERRIRAHRRQPGNGVVPPQGPPALLPVFRSRVQAGILAAILLNPDQWFSLSQLARRIGCSVTAVEKEIRPLLQMHVLISRTDGAMTLFQAATSSPLLTPLTELMLQTYGVPRVVEAELSRVNGVASAIVGGRWTERRAGIPGEFPECVDVSITGAYAVIDDDALDHAVRRIEYRLRRPVRLRASAGAEAARRGSSGPLVPRQRTRTSPRHREPGVPAAPPAEPLVARLLGAGQLELVDGAAVDPTTLVAFADKHLQAARSTEVAFPDAAFWLVAESVWLVAQALLRAQGLALGPMADDARTATEVLTAQYGEQFVHVERLRHRARTLHHAGNHVTTDEARAAARTARALLTTAVAVAARSAPFVRPPEQVPGPRRIPGEAS